MKQWTYSYLSYIYWLTINPYGYIIDRLKYCIAENVGKLVKLEYIHQTFLNQKFQFVKRKHTALDTVPVHIAKMALLQYFKLTKKSQHLPNHNGLKLLRPLLL